MNNLESANNQNTMPSHTIAQHPVLPLLNSSFPPGECLAYIEAMPDDDDRAVAMGEYYYYTGRAEEAAKQMEPYMDSHDPALCYTANLVSAFASLGCGHTHVAKYAMQNLMQRAQTGLQTAAAPEVHAIGIFTVTAASVLLHLPVPNVPPLQEFMRYLPGGLKLWGCYILAHQAYLDQEYQKALAIAEMGLTLCPQQYPIAEVYVRLSAVMALMSLKRTNEAQAHMHRAWQLAESDSFIQPFGEHHGLLHGMIESYFKKDYPAKYEDIIAITYAFSATWRRIHNPAVGHDVADNLTTTEFTIAMLYNRNWQAKEIAEHMDLRESTVRSYIKDIYAKLGISSKSGLAQFMLR